MCLFSVQLELLCVLLACCLTQQCGLPDSGLCESRFAVASVEVAAPIISIQLQEQAVVDMCAHPVVCVALPLLRRAAEDVVALLLARTLLTACGHAPACRSRI
jgi:hypothetical protein